MTPYYQTINQHYYITTQSNQNVILREREEVYVLEEGPRRGLSFKVWKANLPKKVAMQGGEFSGQLFKYIVITNTTKFITTNVGTHRLNGLNSSLLVAAGAAVAVPRFCLCLCPCLCPCSCPCPCPCPCRCRCGWGWDDAVVEWVGPTLSGWTVLSPWHDVWTLISIWSVGGEDEDSLLPITAFGFIRRWK